MKRFIATVITLVLAFSLTSAVWASSAEESDVEWVRLDLSVATGFPEGAGDDVIHRLQEKIDERMDGAIQFTFYNSGSLVAGTEIYDGVISNACNVGYWQTNYASERFPLTTILEMPTITFNNTTAASWTFHDFLQSMEFEEFKDVHILFASAIGSSAISFVDPIASMDDIEGKQIRAAGLASTIISTCGAIPTSMAITECYEGMRTGLIQGVASHFEACCMSNFFEVAPYLMITPFNNSSNVIIMNKEIWESMPVEQQELLDELCEEVFEEYTCKYIGNPEYNQKLADAIPQYEEITWLEGEALDSALEKLEPITQEYIEKLNDLGFDGEAVYNKAVELADKYNEMYPAEDTKAMFDSYK